MPAFIATDKFTLVSNGKRRAFDIGDSINANVYRSLNSVTRSHFISLKEANKANSSKLNWNEEELNAVIDLYLELFNDAEGTCNDWAVAFRFAKDQRFTYRGIQGVRFIVGQIKAMDSHYAGKGCSSVSQQLQDLLIERDSERFDESKLLEDFDAILNILRA
jgi:hypothetical protein